MCVCVCVGGGGGGCGCGVIRIIRLITNFLLNIYYCWQPTARIPLTILRAAGCGLRAAGIVVLE